MVSNTSVALVIGGLAALGVAYWMFKTGRIKTPDLQTFPLGSGAYYQETTDDQKYRVLWNIKCADIRKWESYVNCMQGLE